MRKALLFAVPFMVVLSVSCVKELDGTVVEETTTSSDEVLTVIARVGDATDTKTAIQSDGTSIYWTPDDAINLFYGSGSAGQFTTAITEATAVAEFTGTLSVATGSTETGHGAKAFWAIYPYNAANTCDGTGVTLTIPGEQEAVAGTFADKLNPTVATAPGLDLPFYNVGSWFLFSVTADDIVSATLSGNNNEDIAGKVRVTMDGSGHPVSSVVEGLQSITITPASGDAFIPDEIYYIVLRPQILSLGYTLTMTKASGASADCVVAKEAEFERSFYRRKRNADNGLVFMLPRHDNEIWYTSSTGDVVNPYSTINIDANIVSNTYSNGHGIIVFDASPTIIGNGTFYDCDDLVSISLPNSVTSIGDSAFQNCTNMVSATLPDNVTSLGVVAFDGCTSLEEIDIPDSVQELGEGCFSDCSSLIRVSMPANLSIISANCFDGCSSLSDISIPSNVTKIERYAFRGCVSLPSVFTLPNNVWYIGDRAFYNCTSLSKVYILRETGTTIETSAFNMCTCYLYVPSVSLERYSISARTGTLYPFNKICSFDAEYIEPVDLGLSIKWAPVNVGAATPTERGGRFAWGEITTKEEYELTTYKWYDYDNSVYTRYTNVSRNALNGTPDNYVELYYWDDAARMNWGSDWRMPTITEIKELVRECVWTPVWKPGYTGLLLYMQVTGPNGNSIILPTDAVWQGCYLSRELTPKISQYDNGSVEGLLFYPYDPDEEDNQIEYLGAHSLIRYDGHAVRPVYEKL